MNLQNHFLIAMPSLDDLQFERALVYICEHNSNGAMGLIVNRPINEISVQTLLAKLGVENSLIQNSISQNSISQNPLTKVTLTSSVFSGGPLAQDHGFILHTSVVGFAASLSVSAETMVTTSKDILDVLGTDQQPKEVLVILGYSSWSGGQLEQELIENSWLVVEADHEILFHIPVEQRWQAASKKLGVNIFSIANHVGHA